MYIQKAERVAKQLLEEEEKEKNMKKPNKKGKK
jgi:hypothetical protein